MGFGQRRFDAIASRAWRLRCAPRSPRSGVAFERDTRGLQSVEKVPIVLNRRRRVRGGARIGGGRGRARAGSMDAPVRGAGLTDTRDIAIVARTAEVAMVTVGDCLGPSGSRVIVFFAFSFWLTLRSTSVTLAGGAVS